MDEELAIGLTHSIGMTVSEKDTASRYGSGLIEVFATPAMITLMEKTAQESVQHFLSEGEITLGKEICVQHIKATIVGREVKCTSTLTGINGKVFHFKVTAWDDQGVIGYGTHKRQLVDKKRFLEKLNAIE